MGFFLRLKKGPSICFELCLFLFYEVVKAFS